MRKFELRRGGHSQYGDDGEVINFEAGDVVESESDLCKTFPEKFREVSEGSSKKKKDETSGKDPTDVTKEFSGAEEAELVVTKTGKLYSVFEQDYLEEAIDDGVDLKTKKAVKELIAAYSDSE